MLIAHCWNLEHTTLFWWYFVVHHYLNTFSLNWSRCTIRLTRYSRLQYMIWEFTFIHAGMSYIYILLNTLDCTQLSGVNSYEYIWYRYRTCFDMFHEASEHSCRRKREEEARRDIKSSLNVWCAIWAAVTACQFCNGLHYHCSWCCFHTYYCIIYLLLWTSFSHFVFLCDKNSKLTYKLGQWDGKLRTPLLSYS